MIEPCLCVVWSDHPDGFGDGYFQRFFGSRLGCAKYLFELGPRFLYWVQVRRLGREVEYLRPYVLDQEPHALDLMGTQVIHHYCVTGLERRTQDVLNIGQKDVAISGLFDGHRRNDSVQAHRAQNGHDFPVSPGRCFTDAPATGATRIESRPRGRDAAFVQENQVFRSDRRDSSDKLLALFAIGFGISLGGVE